MKTLLDVLREQLADGYEKNIYFEKLETEAERIAFLDALIDAMPMSELLSFIEIPKPEPKHSTGAFLLTIQNAFQEKLMEKTGWGRNDVMEAYKDVVLAVSRAAL